MHPTLRLRQQQSGQTDVIRRAQSGHHGQLQQEEQQKNPGTQQLHAQTAISVSQTQVRMQVWWHTVSHLIEGKLLPDWSDKSQMGQIGDFFRSVYMCQNVLILKRPRLVTLGTNLTQFGTNLTSLGCCRLRVWW